MKIFFIKFLTILILTIFSILLIPVIGGSYAQTPTETPTPTPDKSLEKASDLQKQIQELQNKISELQGQKNTLASQIAGMNNNIKLTELKIASTLEEIAILNKDIGITTEKITKLEGSLDDLTKILLNRIVATYQSEKAIRLQTMLSSTNLSDFFTKANYLKIVQTNDRKLIFETTQAKNDYSNQKTIFETKKTKVVELNSQLEGYKTQLSQEKLVKENLLNVTKNDEKKYQDLLARARAEYEAIQNIVAGGGTETRMSDVSEGQKIASIIDGPSCNSSGGHLHFIVSRSGGTTENPFNYLKSVDYENCSGSSCGNGDGDSFSPSGSWSWPMDPKIRLTQGYGETWATKYTWVGQIYKFHNGLDITGSSLDIKAVQGGTLYQGSYSGYQGCRLRYVRVDHKDSDIETYYLHVNYIF